MKLTTICFLLLALAQIGVPLHMIRQRETVLRDGTLYRFITEPIDPADPFQGRYVWLNIERDTIIQPRIEGDSSNYYSHGFASIAVDEHGYAYFDQWLNKHPKHSDYLATRGWGWSPFESDKSQIEIRIEIPFDRFYMEEAKAPRAEQIARDASQDKACWVEVRILNGTAVIEDVVVEGQSLRDLAAAE